MGKDYSKGVIYVIKNIVNDKMYVGSTIQDIQVRFNKHKADINSKKGRTIQLYIAIRELGKDKFFIEEVEKYPCNNKIDLTAREGYWIKSLDTYKNGYNQLINGRTKKEHYEDNKEDINAKRRDKYVQDKDKIQSLNRLSYQKYKDKRAEQSKIYQEKNKEKIAERTKLYREKNKESKKVKDKLYYEKNKEAINVRQKQIVTCGCGCKIQKVNVSEHLKTIKHQEFIKNQDTVDKKENSLIPPEIIIVNP